MLIVTTLPKFEIWLTPLKNAEATLVTRSPADPPGSLPSGAGTGGLRRIVPGRTLGARRMAKAPRPKVVASRTAGSPRSWVGRPVAGLIAPRLRSRLVTSTVGR